MTHDDLAIHAAERLRQNLTDAKEGNYYGSAWYAKMNKLDIEIVLEAVLGPEVEEPKPTPREMMKVQALAPDGTVMWEADAPMDSIRVTPGQASFDLDPDSIRVNDEYVIEMGKEITLPELEALRDGGSTYVTGVGQVLRGVHDPSLCAGRPCVIHNPSEHHMREWPTNWRHGGVFDVKPPHMERICPHGIGHPDPDDVAYMHSCGENIYVHGCDGCCVPPEESPAPAPRSSARMCVCGRTVGEHSWDAADEQWYGTATATADKPFCPGFQEARRVRDIPQA